MKISNVLVAAIFLVLISLFSLNFEELTGYAPKQTHKIPEIGILNPTVDSGEEINVRVKLNGYCVDANFEVVNMNGLHKDDKLYSPTEDDCAGQSFHSCKSYKYCVGDIENDVLEWDYKTQADFYGDYKVRVHYIERPGQEQQENPFVEVEFTVI
jgi:hypothetical protein